MVQWLKEDPLVYGQYTQLQLDQQYDQRTLVHDPQVYKARKVSESARVRSKLSAIYDVQYGAGPDETLDLFRAVSPHRPILVFIHGGAWKAGNKDESSYVAEWFVAREINVAILNFSLVPDVRLEEQVRQVASAIQWLHKMGSHFGLDSKRLVVLGHSSGAHLAAMMGPRSWTGDRTIRGVAAFSGMYDLEPVRLSWRNQYLRLSEEEAKLLSPIQMIHTSQPPMVIGYGSNELAEFQRQGRDYCSALRKHRCDVSEMVFEGKNHFDVQEMLIDPDSSLVLAVLALFGDEIKS